MQLLSLPNMPTKVQ